MLCFFNKFFPEWISRSWTGKSRSLYTLWLLLGVLWSFIICFSLWSFLDINLVFSFFWIRKVSQGRFFFFLNPYCGVPAVTRWVKNPTAVAWVAAELQICSLAQRSGLKDPALLGLGFGFIPSPGTFHMPWVQTLKKILNVSFFKAHYCYFLLIFRWLSFNF